MTDQQELALLVALYLMGVGLRIFWPYLLALIQEGESFDYRYVIGQVLVSFVGLIGLLSQEQFLRELELMGFVMAAVAGFGASSIGRNGQKTTDLIRHKQ